MSAWTPGPWEIIQLPSMQYRIDAKVGPLHVCPAIANGLGDAHLIAVAPEMYETVKNFLSDWDGYTKEELVRRVNLGEMDTPTVQRIMKARAVISKAEGKP